MKNMFKMTLYLIGFLTLFSICHADNKKENLNNISLQNDQIIKAAHASGGLIFATPPYWGRSDTLADFSQLAKHLGHAINQNVTLVILKDYESIITRTLNNEIDIGFYGPSPYVKTKKKYPKPKYLATTVWKTTGKHSYYGYLITRQGSGLKSISSLEGKTFAFGSKESTAGYKYPMA